MRIIALAAMAVAAVLLSACAAAPQSNQTEQNKLDELLGLMRERLELAAQAARESWLSQPVIEQASDEEELVDAAVNRALDYKLPPELVRGFFQDQLAAAKHIRSVLRAQRQARPNPAPATDRADASRARARVEPASAPLLSALARAYPVLRSDGGTQLLERRAKQLLTDLPGGAETAGIAIAALWNVAN